jgi:hypothetical protein
LQSFLGPLQSFVKFDWKVFPDVWGWDRDSVRFAVNEVPSLAVLSKRLTDFIRDGYIVGVVSVTGHGIGKEGTMAIFAKQYAKRLVGVEPKGVQDGGGQEVVH